MLLYVGHPRESEQKLTKPYHHQSQLRFSGNIILPRKDLVEKRLNAESHLHQPRKHASVANIRHGVITPVTAIQDIVIPPIRVYAASASVKNDAPKSLEGGTKSVPLIRA